MSAIGNFLKKWYVKIEKLSARSSMDRVLVFETKDEGSIPSGRTCQIIILC